MTRFSVIRLNFDSDPMRPNFKLFIVANHYHLKNITKLCANNKLRSTEKERQKRTTTITSNWLNDKLRLNSGTRRQKQQQQKQSAIRKNKQNKIENGYANHRPQNIDMHTWFDFIYILNWDNIIRINTNAHRQNTKHDHSNERKNKSNIT